jgi:glycosyltransferase involved in cell wall biosynthesis
MRITFVCAALDMSGGPRIIAAHASLLAAHGHEVCLVCPLPRRLPRRQRLLNLLRPWTWRPDKPPVSPFDGLGLDIRRVPHGPVLEHQIPDADILIATWWETAEWVHDFDSRKGAKVYLVQGHEVFDWLPVERVRATYRMPFAKIVVSQWLQRIMEADYGDRASVLVPNAIDHAVFTAPPRGKQAVPTVGFMYATGSVKGADVALEAVRHLRQSLPDLRVLSFGSAQPPDNGFEGVEYLRLPAPDRLRETYASCDVWLCPGRSEGFGLPAMEAMACRTPIVASTVGWPVDAVRDGWNGYLVPPGDALAMHDAALRVLRLDDIAWRALSGNAQQTARRHTWEDSYKLLVAALTRAAQGRWPADGAPD